VETLRVSTFSSASESKACLGKSPVKSSLYRKLAQKHDGSAPVSISDSEVTIVAPKESGNFCAGEKQTSLLCSVLSHTIIHLPRQARDESKQSKKKWAKGVLSPGYADDHARSLQEEGPGALPGTT
jgi:hypothetical protein